MGNYLDEYNKWLNSSLFDEETKKELANIKDEREIEDRFYTSLTFGTAGIRGIIGAGTNRMNIYTIGKATQGLANYINKNNLKGGVVIGYDSRHKSKEFALDSALVLAGNGIKVYLFDKLTPTPEISFAIRKLGAVAGINITASHNPPEYNGYKCYDSEGSQMYGQVASDIVESISKVKDYGEIKRTSKEEGISSGLIKIIGKDIEDEYINTIKGNIINPQAVEKMNSKIKIVYTPFCGTGRVAVLRVLKEMGFTNVWTVKEQLEPDGDFPTLKYPNPEEKEAFTLAIKLAKEKDADIVLANDPDADRLGVYVKDSKTKNYVQFTGNMSGTLLLEYILSSLKENKKLEELKGNGAVISSIVTTKMAKPITESYGLTHFDVLTGFKNIGELIKKFETNTKLNNNKLDKSKGAYKFLFGFEESYGCLFGDQARDKDGIMAVISLIEASCYYMQKGITLVEQMDNIYKKYGYYKEGACSKTLSGKEGAKKIKMLMQSFRQSGIEVRGEKVIYALDYLQNTKVNLISKEEIKVDLPKSDVMSYELDNGGFICVRPSGTEPKIRIYFGVKQDSLEKAEKLIETRREDIEKLIESKIK